MEFCCARGNIRALPPAGPPRVHDRHPVCSRGNTHELSTGCPTANATGARHPSMFTASARDLLQTRRGGPVVRHEQGCQLCVERRPEPGDPRGDGRVVHLEPLPVEVVALGCALTPAVHRPDDTQHGVQWVSATRHRVHRGAVRGERRLGHRDRVGSAPWPSASAAPRIGAPCRP